MYLFHHINFQIPAIVHLVYITRDDFSNTQMSIISDIQPGFATFQKFFFGGALGQHSGASRFNEVSPGDFDVRVIRLGRARVLRVLRTLHSLFDGWISGESWSIMGWFRRRLMSGSIRSSRSELRFSKDWLFGRLTSLCPLAGLYLYTEN